MTLDEPGSDAARAALEAAEPVLVKELVGKEQQRPALRAVRADRRAGAEGARA